MNPTESELLRRAVQLALDHVENGGGPFGALVVLDGRVMATGVNSAVSDADPTAHAEVAAVRAACRELRTHELVGATVVSSCEPCAMCHTVCTVAGVARIVYAAPKEFVPDLGRPPSAELVAIQTALRGLAGNTVRYVPTPGADEPFTRFAAKVGEQS